MRPLLLALVLAVMPVIAMAQAGAPVATLDRSRVGVGETVTLNIEMGDDGDGPPDLSSLMADFVVLGTSTNHSLSIVNGRREAHNVLGIALRPRREGHLTIPALVVGTQRTQPLALDVEGSSSNDAATADRPVVLEGKVDPSQAYIGQQIDYTLRLYFAVNLADGQMGDPSAEGAEVRRVGQDANFQSTRGGRRFNVIERHYAIFPQRAGTLEIQPPTFQGTAVDTSDPGAFFGGGSPVNAVAERLRVDVKARPAGATDGAWIPARELHLSIDGLPADGKARVGQPLTLTMRLDATGMPFEALPALSLPTLDGADVYPDKAVTGGSTSGPWITGRRQQGFAVVPTRAGTLHIPATTLHWWNVATDKADVATVPARDIEVVAGPGGAGAQAMPTAPGAQAVPGTDTAAASSTSAAGSAASGDASAAIAVGNDRLPWRWLFAGAVALWLLTIAAWFLVARRRRREPVVPGSTQPSASRAPTREKPAREEYLSLTRNGNPQAIERALLAWARISRPSITSSGALASSLQVGPQRDAIAGLQRARFAGGELDRAALHGAFVDGFAWMPSAQGGDEGGLPPLYPR